MKIHEIARLCRTTIATVRHYEQVGLLDEKYVTREPNGYRVYSMDAVNRILLIKTGTKIGLSLRYMATELKNWDSGLDVKIKKEVLQQRLKAIEEQIVELNNTRRIIEREIQKDC